MTAWKTFDVEPSLLVAATKPQPTIPSSVEAKIETIWQNKRQQAPTLFNGHVFSATTLSPARIEGYWTEYRRVLAQMEEPDLFPILQLRPLAVTGLLSNSEGFIMGLRTETSIYMANYWQSPPAGTVENRTVPHEGFFPHTSLPIDLNEQILSETYEELGLTQHEVHVGLPLTTTEHEFTHIVDIGITLTTSLSFADIYDKWKALATKEYSKLDLLTFEEARASLLPSRFSPLVLTSSELLKAWRKK